MIKRLLLAGSLVLSLLFGGRTAHAQPTFDVDICIYGGTSAGVIAAYTARMYGKTVLLVEPGRHLGGMTSGGLGLTDIGNKYAITGLSRDFYRRVGNVYGSLEAWRFEPHVAEQVFEQYVDEAGIDVLFSRRLKSVQKQGAEIREITLAYAGEQPHPQDVVVRARMFLDTSYEGDLMAQAGVSYTVGREANSVYGETINGVQLFGRHQFPDGVDPYVIPGDSSSGLLPEISAETLAPRGTGDRKVQTYNFRMCLCQDEANRLPLPRPEGYNPARYELLLRLLERAPWKNLNEGGFSIDRMPNGKTDWNNRGGFSTDYIGKNWDYPEADYEERARIWQEHTNYQQGLIYFLAHDERVPEHLRREMQTWGLCRDEFLDTGGWPHQLYVREARRMIGAYVMTEHNATGRVVAEDAIGMAAYTMDSHNTQRLVVNGMVKNEGNVEVGGWAGDDLGGAVKVDPYPIAYGTITPKPEEATNLLVPVALSASHIAYGSIRMEPVFMVLGQSAAVAASMALDAGTTVQQVDLPALQRELQRNPLADGSTPEILIDDRNESRLQTTGNWTRLLSKQAGGIYGPSALVATEAASARFLPAVEREGVYAVYLYGPRLFESYPPAAARALVTIAHADGVETKTADLQANAGDWLYLGSYRFEPGRDAFVEVSGQGDGESLVVDAVLLKPEQ